MKRLGPLAFLGFMAGCNGKPHKAPVPVYVDTNRIAMAHPAWLQADRLDRIALQEPVTVQPPLPGWIAISLPPLLTGVSSSPRSEVSPHAPQLGSERAVILQRKLAARSQRLITRETEGAQRSLIGELLQRWERTKSAIQLAEQRLTLFDKQLSDLELKEIALLSLIRSHEGEIRVKAEQDLVQVRLAKSARLSEMNRQVAEERGRIQQAYLDERERLELGEARRVETLAAELSAELGRRIQEMRSQLASTQLPVLGQGLIVGAVQSDTRTKAPITVSALKPAARVEDDLAPSKQSSVLRRTALEETKARIRHLSRERSWDLAPTPGAGIDDRTDEVLARMRRFWTFPTSNSNEQEQTISPSSQIVFSAAQLADAVGGQLLGDGGLVVSGAASIEEAQAGDVVFAENPRYLHKAESSLAAVIVADSDASSNLKTLIRVPSPRIAFAQILRLLHPSERVDPGIHPSAIVHPTATIASSASIGPLVHIEANARIGERSVLTSSITIGYGCQIGENCRIHSGVRINSGTQLGNRVVLHSGVVLGADGFGFIRIGSEYHKVPQVGNVIIGDDVEIGANSTVDRAKTGSTVIGARTKLDNLVQIGHHCKIGEDCVFAALVGLAGGVQVGNGVILAGMVGAKDHVTIGDGVIAMGQAGIWSDIEPGSIVSGSPARPHRSRLKILAALEQLPESLRRLAKVERLLAELQQDSNAAGQP